MKTQYIDLGLTSGTLWATCNIGAENPEDYGAYFAWGEIKPKDDYLSSNSTTYRKQINDISGNPQYDAATANWGKEWRMPMYEEFNELVNECTWEWTTQNGVYGNKVIGPNGNHIFLPAAGYRDGSSLYGVNEHGSYWSSTPGSDYIYAYYCGFNGSSCYMRYYSNRHFGKNIRPVRA